MTAMGSDFFLNYLGYGQDGSVYAMGTPTNPTDAMPYGGHIFKNTQDGDTWEDVTPENLTKADDNGTAAFVTDVDALADGSLCVANGSSGQAEIYKDGEKVFSTDMEPMVSNFQNTIGTSQNRLAVTAKDGKSITFYNTDDYSETGSAALTKKGEAFNLAPGADGTWYCLTEGGIVRFQETGDLMETLLDGSYGKMGATGISVVSFFS